MTFEDPVNPNVRPNPFTQDVGRSDDVKSFKQTPMMRNEHEDPDFHFIGQGLPAPSVAEMKPTGSTRSVGESPFPARADHEHDSQAMWATLGRTSGKTCPPGETFINTLTLLSGGVGFGSGNPAGSQILVFPREGVWLTQCNFYVERDGGGAFTRPCHFRSYFFNGTFNRYEWRYDDESTQSTFRVANWDQINTFSGGSTDNVQWSYSHADVVNHIVYAEVINTVRLGNLTYVP